MEGRPGGAGLGPPGVQWVVRRLPRPVGLLAVHRGRAPGSGATQIAGVDAGGWGCGSHGGLLRQDGRRQHTVAEIAEAVGVHRTTVYDYLSREG